MKENDIMLAMSRSQANVAISTLSKVHFGVRSGGEWYFFREKFEHCERDIAKLKKFVPDVEFDIVDLTDEHPLDKANEQKLKPGDRIIWDSHHGYDLGYFLSEGTGMYDTYNVNMVTGVVQGKTRHSRSEIKKYTPELEGEMIAKYGSMFQKFPVKNEK